MCLAMALTLLPAHMCFCWLLCCTSSVCAGVLLGLGVLHMWALACWGLPVGQPPQGGEVGAETPRDMGYS